MPFSLSLNYSLLRFLLYFRKTRRIYTQTKAKYTRSHSRVFLKNRKFALRRAPNAGPSLGDLLIFPNSVYRGGRSVGTGRSFRRIAGGGPFSWAEYIHCGGVWNSAARGCAAPSWLRPPAYLRVFGRPGFFIALLLFSPCGLATDEPPLGWASGKRIRHRKSSTDSRIPDGIR